MWLTVVCPIGIAIIIGLLLIFTANKWLPWVGALYHKARTNLEQGIEEFQKEVKPESQEDQDE